MAEAFTRAAIDPKRMAVAGFSDGASYALSLGARNSAMFRNILAFSAGLMVPGDTGPPANVFISHGDKDHILPIATSRDILAPALKQAGQTHPLILSGDCTNCGRCIDVCSKEVFSFGLRFNNSASTAPLPVAQSESK